MRAICRRFVISLPGIGSRHLRREGGLAGGLIELSQRGGPVESSGVAPAASRARPIRTAEPLLEADERGLRITHGARGCGERQSNGEPGTMAH